FGCATPVQELWPPPEGAPTHTIVVSLDTWHAMIAITLDERVTALDRKSVFEEWGYAEQAWYLEGRQGITGARRALLWPSPGLVGLQPDELRHAAPSGRPHGRRSGGQPCAGRQVTARMLQRYRTCYTFRSETTQERTGEHSPPDLRRADQVLAPSGRPARAVR